MKRYDLAVQVRQRHRIVIHQKERAHAASCKCLRHVAADSPDAEDGNLRGIQLLHPRIPEQEARTFKLRVP